MKHAELVELEKKATSAPMKEIFLYEWRNAAPAYFAVVEKAKAFVEKFARIEPTINDRFVFSQAHGFKYDGPTYGEELTALRDALARVEEC